MGHKIKCVSCKHDTVTGCLKKMPSWNTKKSRNCNAYELMTGTTVNTPPTTTKHRQNGKASYCESETGVSLFYP